MTNNISFKFLLTFILFGFFNAQALAFYKHKVVVNEFNDPQSWQQPYSPGKILSSQLKQHLISTGKFHLLPDKNRGGPMNGKMHSPELMDKSPEKMKQKPMKMKNLGSGHDMKKHPVMNGSGALLNSKSINEEYSSTFDNFSPVQGSMMGEIDKMAPKAPMMSDDPIPWPVRLGKVPEKAFLFKIQGQVVKFNPDSISTPMTKIVKEETRNSENAELEVMLQLVQNKTGRVVHKQTFRAFLNSGKRPFSEDIDLSPTELLSHESSSMSLALSFLAKEMAAYIKGTISTSTLEGEIIAIKNEDVLINIGRQNGVKVGDRFRVFSVGLGLEDPLTETDLGDIYEKMGVIQVVESMLGFSKAVTMIGKEFMPGNLVQSAKKNNRNGQRFSSELEFSESEEKIPWWDFNGAKAVP